MEFKMINNSSLSAVFTLFLVIVLCQSKIFNFLLETAWGRFLLLTLIIVISYLNKILGVVSVLFVIIMFNQSDIAVFEGFVGGTNGTPASIDEPGATPDETPDETPDATINKPPDAHEGFDMIGTENNIKRGKQSNSIPVNTNNNSDDVSPYDDFNGSQSYSSF